MAKILSFLLLLSYHLRIFFFPLNFREHGRERGKERESKKGEKEGNIDERETQ